MKVELKQVASLDEEQAIICAYEVTDAIRSAIDILDNNCRVIPVMKDDKTLMCPTDKIYYIESVDKHSYVYTKDDCYQTKLP